MKNKIIVLVMLLVAFNCHSINIKAVSYDAITTLTAEEIDIYSKHPRIALFAKNAATDAENAAKSDWKKYTLYQGNGDAFRHAYWSALMTKRISRDWAYTLGLAHEGLKKGYDFSSLNDDVKMDISNNYEGRIEGDKYKNYSDVTIRGIINVHVKHGTMKRVRLYSSKKTKDVFDGVYTKYVGYYKKTSDGGFVG